MNINPYILLGIGCTFALLYACVITLGWARTRRNRRELQEKGGISIVPTLVMDPTIDDAPLNIKTVSLSNNHFVDTDGNHIDIESYLPYIAVGESVEFPHIHNGDLILKDRNDNICYVFTVPNLIDYR